MEVRAIDTTKNVGAASYWPAFTLEPPGDYELTLGVAQDRVRAHMWFNLAAAISTDGNAKPAAKNRDIMT